ncbi:MAG: hypothetical protein A2W03_18325 [Candidatus Aminicenantes bacterium RBG_16_63_16]|nr:MAG: hypothetical protein A2W03_18325 [Candidatus Aminicenantes bacterium RBG_16_63_16]
MFSGSTVSVLKRSSDRKLSVTFFCMPRPKETIETRAPIPIITPEAVRIVRSLRFQRLVRANRRWSPGLI